MSIKDKFLNSLGQLYPPRPFKQPTQRKAEEPREDQSYSTESDTGAYLIDEKSPSPTSIIYQSELDYLSRCILDYPNIETGGQLFGFWSNQGVPVVLYTIGPGPRANHEQAFFNQDSNYLMTIGNELLDRYGLCHIGEWHSHHQLGLARPSGHDARTMHNGLIRIPQRRLLLCIGNYENGRSAINPYNFHENDLRGYADAAWQVIPLESPFRKMADRDLNRLLVHPRTDSPRHGRNRVLRTEPAEQEVSTNAGIHIPATYWVARKNNLSTLKKMLQYTGTLISGEINTQADETGTVQFHIEDPGIDIRFTAEFPRTAPEIYVRGTLISPEAEWQTPEDDEGIYSSYKNWLDQLSMGANG